MVSMTLPESTESRQEFNGQSSIASTKRALLFETLIKLYRWVFARAFFYRVNVLFYRLSLSGLGMFNYENDKVSGEAHFLAEYLKDREHCVVIDVGAHSGAWSRRVLQIKPDAKIIALEPHPDSFRSLSQIAPVLALNVGCGSHREKRPLFDHFGRDGGTEHASFLREAITTHKGSQAVEHMATMVRLDDLIEELGIERVDLLKIDVEGLEYDVLKGALRSLETGLFDAIQFEFNEMNVFSRVFMHDFFELMKGYCFYRLLPHGLLPLKRYIPLTEIFAYQNIVAKKIEV